MLIHIYLELYKVCFLTIIQFSYNKVFVLINYLSPTFYMCNQTRYDVFMYIFSLDKNHLSMIICKMYVNN